MKAWVKRSAMAALGVLFLLLPKILAAEEGTAAPAAYDLVLFFVQSNMLGNAIGTDNPFAGMDPEAAALASGIDEDLIRNPKSAKMVEGIEVPDGAALEFRLTEGDFVPLTGSTLTGEYGEDSKGTYVGVRYSTRTKKFEKSYLRDGRVPNMAAVSSLSLNMIPEFCAEWYQRTGHGVIVLFCAVGGAPIQAFLPVTDPLYQKGHTAPTAMST